MLNPDERERSAIHMIACSTEGKEFIGYLEKCLKDEDSSNRQKEDIQMYRGQGAAILLEELIKLVK